MNSGRRSLRLLVAMAVVSGAPPAICLQFLGGDEISLAQASLRLPHENTFELQESLFVQDPHLEGAKGGIQVLWIPQPIQRYCLGKTAKECITIDYCIRTTNKNVSMCQNLSVDLARLPAYPPEIRPRRVLSVIYFPVAPVQSMARLRKFFESAPEGTLDRLSASARIKARIKVIRSSEDDQFELLEVLAVPPF